MMQKTKSPISDADLESAILYEANIRQYSAEGTFQAFAKDVPGLKELGVKIIWLMPIFPISTTKSKGSLGSYYAISDYTKINPEFGTLGDFQNLVQVIHDNDMFVILDWVANHTGWDHHWLKEHPEFYTKDKQGEITHTPDTDWTDVADLDYGNPELRKEMTAAMIYWIKEQHIDGYRCDMASLVPMDFWNTVVPKLREVKPIFMMAEGWEPALLKNGSFEMVYSWDTHHRMNDIAQGKKGVSALDQRLATIADMYPKEHIVMNFVTNHDENSWNGSIYERMGEAGPVMTVLSYTLPGMPLIYSGQEYDMKKRLKFFEKDFIAKEKGKTWSLLATLAKLKKQHAALDGGKKPGSFERLPTTKEGIFTFKREKNDNKVIIIANLSSTSKILEIKNLVGSDTYTDSDIGSRKSLDKVIELEPWGYRILTN